MRRHFTLILALGTALCLVTPAGGAAPKVDLELKAAEEGASRGGVIQVDALAHIANGWHINAHEPNQPYLIPTELTLTPPQGVEVEGIHYPQPEKRTFAFAPGQELLVYGGKLGIATAVGVPADFAGGALRIDAALRYQACNDTTCLPPATARATLRLPVVAAVEAADEFGRGSMRFSSPGSPAGEQVFAAWLAKRGLIFTLLAVALLGLGLNLTPCVYPLISVTVAYFGGQARGRTRVAWLATVYVLGIALSFSSLGLVAAFSGGLFGAALQKPAVILFIATVLVVLALGSFGVYQFQPPAALMRWAGGAAGGAAGALFMGLTMGVVAAPCVGPIVLGLLIFVGTLHDPYLGFLLFFFLALGMGAPYVVLAMAAGSIKNLPRSGEWLLWTERLFGCVLLSLATYFVALLLPPPLDRWLLPAAIALSGLYLGFVERAGNALRTFPYLKRAAGVAMVGLAVWLALPAPSQQAIAWKSVESWSTNGGPKEARPVLIDFAAEWCIPCREMDNSTYVDSDVVREAERFHMVKADITEENEATSKIVDQYKVRGVPTVILFSPLGEETHRMVGYVGPDELIKAMREVQQPG